jgi:hypothetical protein
MWKAEPLVLRSQHLDILSQSTPDKSQFKGRIERAVAT